MEEALQVALWQRRHGSESSKSPIQGTTHHSDPGNEKTSQRYTQTLAEEGLVPSIGTIWDAFDNAAAQTVMGLFKNEAAARDSPFRSGPLAAESDVVDIVMDWVRW